MQLFLEENMLPSKCFVDVKTTKTYLQCFENSYVCAYIGSVHTESSYAYMHVLMQKCEAVFKLSVRSG